MFFSFPLKIANLSPKDPGILEFLIANDEFVLKIRVFCFLFCFILVFFFLFCFWCFFFVLFFVVVVVFCFCFVLFFFFSFFLFSFFFFKFPSKCYYFFLCKITLLTQRPLFLVVFASPNAPYIVA